MATVYTVEAHGKRFQVRPGGGPMAPLESLVQAALVHLIEGGAKLTVTSSDCQLLLNNKALDLKMPTRFANIPTGAKLKLITGQEPVLGVQQSAPATGPPALPTAAGSQPAAAQSPAPDDAIQSSGAEPHAGPDALACAVGVSDQAASRAEETQGQLSAATHAEGPQDPLVAIFGRKVLLFTREAEEQERARRAESTAAPTGAEIPEEYYEFTESDYRRVAAGLAAARAAELKSGMLRTKQMREAEDRHRAEKFGPVAVRAHLPDGQHVLQASFSAVEPVSALLRTLRAALTDEAAAAGFHVYTTPPKTVLADPEATLYAANLIPAAHVYVALGPALRGPAAAPPLAPGGLLRPEVLALVGEPPAGRCEPAAAAATGAARAERAVGQAREAAEAGDGASREGSAKGASMPKWMKLGPK